VSKKRLSFKLPAYSNRAIFLAALALTIFGSIMIVSAEMGSDAGDISAVIVALIRQLLFSFVAILAMIFFSRFNLFSLSKHFNMDVLMKLGYIGVAILLLSTRLFGSLGGAYGWIRLGPVSIQPSEIAKLYLIIMYSYFLSRDISVSTNRSIFKKMIIYGLLYVIIIVVYQSDFGSGIVLFGMGYVMLMVSNLEGCKKYRNRMFILFILGVGLAIYLLTPAGTSFLEKIAGDDYRIKRFLASANPFSDPYGSGYHLIMSLVSFATGGWFGLGIGKSVHKFMNFPNPSSDFILPVIVEELGVIKGLLPILIGYGIILFNLSHQSLKTHSPRARLVYVGTFMYFILHFLLNVGGVSGLIPLTGVPLLLISAGGTSLACCLSAIGIAQAEIVRCRKEKEIYGSDYSG